MNPICIPFCTKTYIKNKKISAHINKKLLVEIHNDFPDQAKDANVFVHTRISCR